MKLIVALTICCVEFICLSVAAGAGDSRTYIIFGSGYSPYPQAVLTLAFNGTDVTGAMVPLRGDSTPPIKVAGDNATSGTLNLKFEANKAIGFGGFTERFKKSVEGEQITWRNESGEISLSRPLNGEPSDAAKTLSIRDCGDAYGALDVTFLDTANEKTILASISKDKELSDSTVQYQQDGVDQFDLIAKIGHEVSQQELKTIYPQLFPSVSLLTFLTKKMPDKSRYMLVPIGTETYYAVKLRKTGLFTVDFDIGGCGGADRSYFTTKKSNLFDGDKFSESKFLSFLSIKMSSFFSDGGKYKYDISKPKITKVNVPPYQIDASYEVRIASEVSRNDVGQWDQFQVFFEPFDNNTEAAGAYSVVTWVERMKSINRGRGNDSPPDRSYFTRDTEYYFEAIAATSIAYGLGDGNCVFAREGFPDEIENQSIEKIVENKLHCWN